MSLKRHHFFEFGDFRLDVEEKTLRLGDALIPLTPKVFDTLSVFLDNPGQLIEKDEFMQRIWPGRFVEESNLSFNIKMLRKALGDDAHNPRFIETVQSRGFRFIAPISQSSESEPADSGSLAEDISHGTIPRNWASQRRLFLVPAIVLVLLLAGGLAVWSWYENSRDINANVPIMRTPFASEMLSTNGKVVHAVISADGRNVFYTNGTTGRQSVWLRQLENSTNVELIPPTDDQYGGLALSPDSSFLYFTRGPRDGNAPLDVYKVSTFGGVPVKVVSEVQGSIGISPDGRQVSFVRGGFGSQTYSLWIADAADGQNERRLVERSRPTRIGRSQISPDGRSIAFAAGQSDNGSEEFGLFEITIDSGIEREITKQKFFNIKGLQWLPDQSRVLLTAARVPVNNYRLWEVFTDSGEVRDLTNSRANYSGMSLSKAADLLVASIAKQDFQLSVFRTDDSVPRRVLVDANTASYAPDGKILFSSSMSGNLEVWRIQPDESGQAQLTNNASDESAPVASADNQSIYFVSNRSGSAHVWRMKSDGTDQVQITRKDGGYPLFVSKDGDWIYYHHGTKRTLWRVSNTSGAEEQVLDMERQYFALSPDGSLLAFSNQYGRKNSISIYSVSGREVVKIIPVEDGDSGPTHLAWRPDGNSLAFISKASYPRNSSLWVQPLDGGVPRQLIDLGEDQVNAFSMSPDGQSFAVVQGGWKYDAVLLRGLR